MASQSSASLFWQEKALCTHRRAALAHMHIHWHPCQPILVFPTATHGAYHQFHIPNFESVTLNLLYVTNFFKVAILVQGNHQSC